MGWDSKRSYPVDVTSKLTVQATADQKARWTAAARRMGKASPGAFLSWAGDVLLALLATYERETVDHADRCNPKGIKL